MDAKSVNVFSWSAKVVYNTATFRTRMCRLTYATCPIRCSRSVEGNQLQHIKHEQKNAATKIKYAA
jgi:hypothetical protein